MTAFICLSASIKVYKNFSFDVWEPLILERNLASGLRAM